MRALVIDDSALSRQAIERIFDASPWVEVVGVARDGEEALRKTFELEPDFVTLDLEMPRMNGFTYLRLVMANRPTPVIVVSGRTGSSDVFRALELGAVDFVAKPPIGAGAESGSLESELLRTLTAVRDLRIEKVRERVQAQHAASFEFEREPTARGRVVVIGSSTGGPAALMRLFESFVEPPPVAFVVAQHMPAGFTHGFADRIDRLTCFTAREAKVGDSVDPGRVLIAPGGAHLEFAERSGRIVSDVTQREPGDTYAPGVDRLFSSAAKHFGSDVLAVVLTGMGSDGSEGVKSVKQAGGSVFAESEDTAVIFGMPRRAIETGCVDEVLPLSALADAIHGRPQAATGANAATSRLTRVMQEEV